MPTEKPRVTFTISQDKLDLIDNYRFDNKFKNQTQAILSLIEKGLSDFETKKAPPYSSEAEKLAHDYDTLDSYGKQIVRLVIDAEKVRCAEQAQSSNVIKIAARDGSFTELFLTDDQIKDLQTYIDHLPDPSDDL